MEVQRQSGARIQILPLFPSPLPYHPLSFPLLYSLSNKESSCFFPAWNAVERVLLISITIRIQGFPLRKLLSSLSFFFVPELHSILGFPFSRGKAHNGLHGFPSRLVAVWSRTFALLCATACLPLTEDNWAACVEHVVFSQKQLSQSMSLPIKTSVKSLLIPLFIPCCRPPQRASQNWTRTTAWSVHWKYNESLWPSEIFSRNYNWYTLTRSIDRRNWCNEMWLEYDYEETRKKLIMIF